MIVDLLQLREWSERLCRLPETEPRQVVAALRVGAAPAAHIRGVGRIDPPPAGTTRCELGMADGRFRSLSMTFARPAIPRATLEDAMGPGLPLRRPGYGRPHRIAYRVVVAGAPFSCDVVASFAEPPGQRSLVTAVTLRRHRGVTRLPRPGPL
jgi:hypothetical protein